MASMHADSEATPENQAGRLGDVNTAAGVEPRWRWYYYYFILAMFDVAVIVASIIVHHETLGSFDRALADVLAMHNRQRWYAELKTALIALNAPGNDIFETGDLAGERRQFVEAKEAWSRMAAQPPNAADLPAAIKDHVDRMIASEEQIFQSFAYLDSNDADAGQARKTLAEASGLMAAMDRAYAAALASLTESSIALLADQRTVLDRHHGWLGQRTRVEFLFVGIVAIILGGIFWYGRQLQQAHARLLEQRKRAEEAKQHRLASVGEVCSACAHGIRNPVAAIASSAQLMLAYGKLDEESSRRTEDIMTTCDILSNRITRMLNYARTPALKLERLRGREILEQAANEVRPSLEARNIALRRQFDDRDIPFVGERGLLIQAMIELLSNSVDQLSEGGTITLICTNEGGRRGTVELGVADTGAGIPDEIRTKVCKLFFSLKPNGNGIGLASVQHTAELHGGTVVIADAEPTGADVRIRLPVR